MTVTSLEQKLMEARDEKRLLRLRGQLACVKLLADMAYRAANGTPLKSFSFRAVSPLFDTEPFTINTDGQAQFWAKTPEGGLAMKADVGF